MKNLYESYTCNDIMTSSITQQKNMSTIDEIASHMGYVKNVIGIKLNGLLICRKVYANYLSVVIHMLRNNYPIKATLRNGNNITLHNHSEASFITISKDNNCIEDIGNDMVTFPTLPYLPDKKGVKIRGSMNNGEVFGIFQNKIYGHIPVNGRIVIDVGANIGDSSIYFALKGAKKVISFEPFPKNYLIAKENIELNNLTDNITILMAGIAVERGFITVDSHYQSSVASSTQLESVLDENNITSEDHIKVPLVTLESVLDENNIGSGEAILKMDCEGCEYDTIISANNDVLAKFSHIHIEYHYGYKNLIQRLEKCGFKVSLIRRPILNFNPENNKKMYIGDIFAIRKTS